MKKDFEIYLKAIGFKKPFLEKVEKVISFYSSACGIDINDIFVSEYINPEGQRVYENLWLFSEKYVMESKSFLNSEDYDIAILEGNIKYWNLKKQDYSFEHGDNTSRMFLDVTLKTQIVALLKASKENCDHLSMIFKKYVMPNLEK